MSDNSLTNEKFDVRRQGRKLGPFNLTQIERMIARQKLGAKDEISPAGGNDWQRVDQWQRDRQPKPAAPSSDEQSESVQTAVAAAPSKDQLENVTLELASAKAEWKIVQKQKATTMQVPRQRSGRGARGIVLLSRAELYLVCSPDHEKGEFFDRHVNAVPIAGSNGYEITPRFGKGIALGSEKSITAIEGTARRLSRDGSTLIIAVYPDSYRHFAPVRDAFKSFGMNYELWIQDEDESLQIFYGSGLGRVQ